jgi:hypothetical protein
VIAKVEWHQGELYPRVGFIVTNISRPAENVVAKVGKHFTVSGSGSGKTVNILFPNRPNDSRLPAGPGPSLMAIA